MSDIGVAESCNESFTDQWNTYTVFLLYFWM